MYFLLIVNYHHLLKNTFRDFLWELGLFFAGFYVGMKKLVAFISIVPGHKNITRTKERSIY